MAIASVQTKTINSLLLMSEDELWNFETVILWIILVIIMNNVDVNDLIPH